MNYYAISLYLVPLTPYIGENILQVIVDYEKVYGMTSVVDGVGIWIINGIWVVEVLPWKKNGRKS